MPQLPDYFLSPNIHGLKVPKLMHLWDKVGLPVSGIPVLVHVYFWHCNNSLKKLIFKNNLMYNKPIIQQVSQWNL
jgi:hypothetical protein